jgi:hypothetical protein
MRINYTRYFDGTLAPVNVTKAFNRIKREIHISVDPGDNAEAV